MNFKPLSDHVLIRPVQEEVKNTFGLILPDKIVQKDRGIVLSEGPDVTFTPSLVGKMVFYLNFGPSEITIKDEVLVLVKQNDIIAIWEDV